MKPFIEIVQQWMGESVLASRNRPATERDIENMTALHGSTGKCYNGGMALCFDEECFMYDKRICFICKKDLGRV